MIHQLIFASPKPGMSEAEFQHYWLNVHAVKYASKIPQIKGYKVDTRISIDKDINPPLFSGIAEIWLKNEEEQLASLQTKEFIEGARRDEPNWAAFWKTVALDTETHKFSEADSSTDIKNVTLIKRKPGLDLEEFRRYCLDIQSKFDLEIPGLKGYAQCHVKNSSYSVFEPCFDLVFMHWFESQEGFSKIRISAEYKFLQNEFLKYVDKKYIHSMLVKDHWIIGPKFRD